MVKRALFFSTPYSLSLRDNQMIIRTKEAPDMQRTVPVEDIAAGGTDGGNGGDAAAAECALG